MTDKELAQEIRESLFKNCFSKWLRPRWWFLMNEAANRLERGEK